MWPLSLLYGAVATFRNICFNCGLLKQTEFDTPTICVGNISVGGTGKTPHVEYLVRLLSKQFNNQVATLSRGYGRSTSGFVLADSTATATTIGDEPNQIRCNNPGIIVCVDENRCRAISKLQQLPQPPKVIILDDAYQHRYVKPKINILLVDYNRPIFADTMMPSGRLREPRWAKKRANVVVVTKCPENVDKQLFARKLRLKPSQQLFFSTFKYGSLKSENGTYTLSKNNSVLAFTGIAHPENMLQYLQSQSAEVKSLRFADHHNFTQTDIDQIVAQFNSITNKNKLIVTTEKDFSRLVSSPLYEQVSHLPLCRLPIEVEFVGAQSADFDNIVIDCITK